jgi:NAD(P)-dependent dehydrogenase (short-subunit alcohol dehydrogenase family)
MDLYLRGHTALVTGSSRGTGLVIARRLLTEGARVLVHGLEPGQAERAVAEIGGGVPVTGDITGDAGSAEVLAACAGETVDILINNYGTADAGTWEGSDTEDWLLAYQKNVLSAQRLIRALPNARMPQYYAAKGALATLTISLAREVAGTGIRVNLVSPGLILTPEVESAWLERGRARGWGSTWAEIEPHVAADIPIRRIARREEVADLVAFLASPLADAIHGQNIRVDGGAMETLT